MDHRITFREKENDARNQELHSRIKRGESLTKEEYAFFCDCLKFENLSFLPFCYDQYFLRMFFSRNSEPHGQLDFLNVIDNLNYNIFIQEWNCVVGKTNHSEQLLQTVAKETRAELKILQKQFQNTNPCILPDLERSKFQMLEWSRFRYIKIKEIFELDIKAEDYKLILNNEQIIYKYSSLSHILTRHYGGIMKPYATNKDHFTEDIHLNQIHIFLKDIFKKIDNSGYYKLDSIKEINFRFNNKIYRVYTEYENSGYAKTLTIKTFFPIGDRQMLNKLEEVFIERIIDHGLSVFVKNGG